jgi:thymidine phosphorylase
MLEARDVIWVLKNDSRLPQDLKQKSLLIAGKILEMAGKCKKENGMAFAAKLLSDGSAFRKFVEIAKAQGIRTVNPEKLLLGKFMQDVHSHKAGTVKWIDNHAFSKIARVAGAPLDKCAGVYLHKKQGDKVKKGELIFTIFSNNKERLVFAKNVYTEMNGFEIR